MLGKYDVSLLLRRVELRINGHELQLVISDIVGVHGFRDLVQGLVVLEGFAELDEFGQVNFDVVHNFWLQRYIEELVLHKGLQVLLAVSDEIIVILIEIRLVELHHLFKASLRGQLVLEPLDREQPVLQGLIQELQLLCVLLVLHLRHLKDFLVVRVKVLVHGGQYYVARLRDLGLDILH